MTPGAFLPLSILFAGGLGALLLSFAAGVVACQRATPRPVRLEAALASAVALIIAGVIAATMTHPAFRLAAVLP